MIDKVPSSTVISKLSESSSLATLVPVMLVSALLLAPPARSQTADEMRDDLLHSDLPFFGRGGAENVWPQHFADEDSFGCTSRVAFGDWVFRKRGAEDAEGEQWYRFGNYGVFHCWANTSRAYERSKLGGAESHPSFFVLLGKTTIHGNDVELWTIQIGTRPGSDYVLLSRAPNKERIEEFTVLQAACPRENVRDGGSLDILSSRYCAIDSRADLIRLARRMAQRPPLGTLTLLPSDDQATQDSHE